MRPFFPSRDGGCRPLLLASLLSAAAAERLVVRELARGTAQEVTFVRHGESTGNQAKKAPMQYLIENKGSVTAWRDGHLTKRGEQEAASSAATMGAAALARARRADMVMVSPLARAMATAVILLGAVRKSDCVDTPGFADEWSGLRVKREVWNGSCAEWKGYDCLAAVEGWQYSKEGRAAVLKNCPRSCGLCSTEQERGTVPLDQVRIVVTSEMREKVSSQSDVPGTNPEDIHDYIRDLGRRYGRLLFGDPRAFDAVVFKLLASYDVGAEASKNWTLGATTTADAFLENVRGFKARLAREPSRHVLLVGHNGWARTTFSAGLRSPCDASENYSSEVSVVFGARKVQELRNLGVLTTQFADNDFQTLPMQVHSDVCEKAKDAIIESLAEAKSAGLLPWDAIMHRVLLSKSLDRGQYKDRFMILSASGNRSRLAWSGKMGEPKKYIELGVGNIKIGAAPSGSVSVRPRRAQDNYIHAMTHGGAPDDVNAFWLSSERMKDLTVFVNLLMLFDRYASDTAFLTRVLRGEGWIRGLGEVYDAEMKATGTLHRSILNMSRWDAAWIDDWGGQPAHEPLTFGFDGYVSLMDWYFDA